jgi:pimeloyl-ACP methyl ester carboxylesterase
MSDDPNVRAAIAHWAPRFIANGVDYNDFVTTTSRVAQWRDWSAEWSRTAAKHEALAGEAEARRRPLSAAEAHVRAAICHHFGKFVFFEDMAQYRRAGEATVGNYRKALEYLDPPAERVLIPFGGSALPGYLRRPAGIDRPPVALIVCGLDSVKEEMNSFEPLFHRNRLATLTFDGPGQGESEALPIEPRFETVVAAVLDWLAGRDDLDGARVAAVGISLGGYYVARAAAYEGRLACAASVGGPYDLGEVFPTMPLISRQAIQIRSHSKDMDAAQESARALSMAGAAGRIGIPFMTVFGTEDRLIPLAQAERLHAEIPHPGKRLVVLEGGNHVCNNMPFAWRPLVADWMAGHLGCST